MYERFFGLTEPPFSIAPDPRYLYMSEKHREALAHLLYGIDHGGFVLLTGEVGTGKTTICRCLIEQMSPDTELAFIFNPKLTAIELLETLCDEFRIRRPPGGSSIKTLIDRINEHLLAQHARGRTCVLIIDEAQNLTADVLEQMRLLTNLETNDRKLLQVIMIGQPELRTMLKHAELRQLAQRVTARYHLGPLDAADVAAYVARRLEVAGVEQQLFPPKVLARLHRLSGGVPRLINTIADRALLGAYVQGEGRVTLSTLERAAQEILDPGPKPKAPRRRLGFAVGTAAVVAAAIAVLAIAPAVMTGHFGERLREVPQRAAAAWQAAMGESGADHGAAAATTVVAARDRDAPGTTATARTATARAETSAPPPVATAPEMAAPGVSSATVTPPVAATGATAAVDTPHGAAATATAGSAEARQATPAGAAPAGSAVAAPIVLAPAVVDAAEPASETAAIDVSAPAAPPPPPPQMDTLAWPSGVAPAASEGLAYQAVLARWGIDYHPGQGDACAVAAAEGLRCLDDTGTLARLAGLDRPAVLKLKDAEGRTLFAALLHLGSSTAEVELGGARRRVAPAELAAQWSGAFTVLWRMPPGYRWPVGMGTEGPVVAWIAKRINALSGDDSAPPQLVFDEGLRERVRRLQAAHQLDTDGIVGPLTLIALDAEANGSGPRLAAAVP